MKVNLIDGGMIFELNKKYKDCGEYAINYDTNLINDIYKSYINMGCKFITTPNYCFKPEYTENWEVLVEKSINITNKFKKNVKIFGCLPPFNRSYSNNDINEKFIIFYKKIIDIFYNKVDYYLIETASNYKEIKKIYEIIKQKDKTTPIIISLYPCPEHNIYIDNYLNMEIYGIFINCCSFENMEIFYNKNLKNKNLKNKKFGFCCNKINEKAYSQKNGIRNLQNYFENISIEKGKIKSFLNNLNIDEIFIGGCCGYGVKEMDILINDLKEIEFIKLK